MPKDNWTNILKFYTRRNGSSGYSKRHKKEFWKVVRLIRVNPHLGETVPGYDNRRRTVVGNFVLAYELAKDVVYIPLHPGRQTRR
ncbi:MAG: type II toxin-antitoxin system RelE/ParE family toxin [Planctomycetaceae bacterium]|nr:type II toxin-antitoxin system RelE/ParE family toxin [Planctomycetaceae bacterium]